MRCDMRDLEEDIWRLEIEQLEKDNESLVLATCGGLVIQSGLDRISHAAGHGQ